MQINSVGIDLGKTTFYLVALGEGGARTSISIPSLELVFGWFRLQ
jgi:hypothetical protein